MTEYEIRQNRLLNAAELRLADTEARLAEAVELLEQFIIDSRELCPLRTSNDLVADARAFLDKVKA